MTREIMVRRATDAPRSLEHFISSLHEWLRTVRGTHSGPSESCEMLNKLWESHLSSEVCPEWSPERAPTGKRRSCN